MTLPNRLVNHNSGREQQGHAVCCNCGHRADPVWTETSCGWRRIWYCESCGALIKALQRFYFREMLLFFPVLLLVAPFFGIVVYLADLISGYLAKFLFLSSLIIWPFFAWALTRAIVDRYFDSRTTTTVEPHGHCLRCDYDLNGTIGDRCPECGTSAVHVLEAIKKWRSRSPVAVHD